MKALILPSPDTIEESNGIGRIIHAQARYLPKHGIELTKNEDEADVIATHTQSFGLKRTDVLHLHGAYWTGDIGSGKYVDWHTKANKEIINGIRRARAVTVPSDWVGEFIRRDFRIDPIVIGHGIDLNEWNPSNTPQEYIFWAKNRPNDVCNPIFPLQLAQAGLPVVSTFVAQGKQSNMPNLKVLGELKREDMRKWLSEAGVYLATTKETWGITTIEAMACGVPVLGFNHGGTSELVRHGIDGWLVEPGDIRGLVAGYDILMKEREAYSKRCLERAKQFTWEEAIATYADLYKKIAGQVKEDSNPVSIVITNYNYARFVGQAIESALRQTYPCEVIVVDDGSKDNSLEVISKYPNVKVIAQSNQGVAAARNNGVSEASGKYIICLDADDQLDKNYVKALLPAFSEGSLGIAYTGLTMLMGDGSQSLGKWPPAFRWEGMATPAIPPSSCIPSAAMYRKEMWKRCGGYRQAYAPAEDTEFWVRGLSIGYSAKKVYEDGMFIYRPHGGSASRVKAYSRIDFWHPWMRDKVFPCGAPADIQPPIHSYSDPLVSIFVPANKSVRKYLPKVLESLLGQTFRNWEVILLGEKIELPTYPFVKWNTRPKAPVLLELTGGTWLLPDAIYKLLVSFRESGKLIESSGYLSKDGKLEAHSNSAICMASVGAMNQLGSKEKYAKLLGTVKLEDALWVSKYIPKPLIPITEEIMCGTCGTSAQAAMDLVRRANIERSQQIIMNMNQLPPEGDVVRMRFIAEQKGSVTSGGPGITPSGKSYRGGNNPFDKYINADKRDVQWLLDSGRWEIVVQPQMARTVEAPQPISEVPPQIIEQVGVELKEDEPVIEKEVEEVVPTPESVLENIEVPAKKRGRKKKVEND